MKRFLNICLAAGLVIFSGCSDDDKDLSKEIAGPLYGLQRGEPGSVDELIYNIWEDCGVYYLYNYGPNAFQVTNWSTSFNYDFTPVKSENMDAVKNVVSTIHDKVFAGMDLDFIHRNWYVRVFLCDELYNSSGSQVTSPYLENADALIIPNVNERLLAYTDADWEEWATDFSDLLISRLYLGASVEPTDFFDLRPKNANGADLSAIYTDAWIIDPDERYSKNVYTFHTYGFIKSRPTLVQVESVMIVTRQTDVADYITFLTKSTMEEMDWCWEHFPLMKQRAHALIPYLYDVLELDLESMQNANVPDDPVPAGYFQNI